MPNVSLWVSGEIGPLFRDRSISSHATQNSGLSSYVCPFTALEIGVASSVPFRASRVLLYRFNGSSTALKLFLVFSYFSLISSICLYLWGTLTSFLFFSPRSYAGLNRKRTFICNPYQFQMSHKGDISFIAGFPLVLRRAGRSFRAFSLYFYFPSRRFSFKALSNQDALSSISNVKKYGSHLPVKLTHRRPLRQNSPLSKCRILCLSVSYSKRSTFLVEVSL